MFENHVVSDPDFQIYFHHWRDFAWLCEKYQIRHFGIQTGVGWCTYITVEAAY